MFKEIINKLNLNEKAKILVVHQDDVGVSHGSNLAFEWAHMIPQFHWGLSAWAIYCLPTIPIAYSYYNQKNKNLSISNVLD